MDSTGLEAWTLGSCALCLASKSTSIAATWSCMPVESSLHLIYSTVQGCSTAASDSSVVTPEVLPWLLWCPPKALGIGTFLARNHIGGQPQTQLLVGSRGSSLLELINPLDQVALRLPDRVANYQPGVPLPARFVSQEELLRIREEVLASSCHLSPDVWSSDLTGKGQRVLVLQYIGGTLQSALSGPSFKELYPLYLSALQSGKSQFESHRIALDLLAAKEQTRSQGGSAIFKEEAAAASPRPAITATATKSAPCLRSAEKAAAVAPAEPNRLTVPRRPALPIGKAALPARPLLNPAPAPSAWSSASGSRVDPNTEVKTPSSSPEREAAGPSRSNHSSSSGLNPAKARLRSRSPTRRAYRPQGPAPPSKAASVQPKGSVAQFVSPVPVAPPAKAPVPRPRAPLPPGTVLREYPHSVLRIAAAPDNYRR